LNSVGQLGAAQASLTNAQTVQLAAEDRLTNGLATLPDVLEARSATAQSIRIAGHNRRPGNRTWELAKSLGLPQPRRFECSHWENMTQAPFVIRGARTGLKLGGGALEDFLFVGLTDTYCGLPMALTAEKLAEQTGITRKDADTYALRSQQLAEAAFKSCYLTEEIVRWK